MLRRLSLAGLVLLTATAPAAVRAAPTNLLLIIADDCTFRDIGCYGGQAHTPHIDRLATQGMRLTRCFQAAPMCSPTRHNIYTGLYPVKSGAYPNHAFAKPGTRSVVQYLKPHGYRVALSGKKHIAPRAVFPFEYSGKQNPDFAAIDSLMAQSKSRGTPFCLFACSNEPHSPWNKGDRSRYDPEKVRLPSYFVDTPETRNKMVAYLAEITFFDSQVGRCLELLEKHKLAENTLVLVLSEQGSSFPFGKWTCYDTGLQSAAIARWPGHIKPGTTSDAMIEYVDILPTFLDVAGVESPMTLDGRSFLPVLQGKRTSQATCLRTDDHPRHPQRFRSLRDPQRPLGSLQAHRQPDSEVPFRNIFMKSSIFRSWEAKARSGDKDAREKVRRFRQRPAEELYDITADPYEWQNLAGDPKLAEVQSRLRAQLDRWMKAQGDRGQQTELEALKHQARRRNNKKKNKKKPGTT